MKKQINKIRLDFNMEKNKFSEQQIRLLEDMLKLIDSYYGDKVSFSYLVSGLEGLLDVGEFQSDQFIKQWYDLWKDLEIINSINTNIIEKKETANELKSMQDFLLSLLGNQ